MLQSLHTTTRSHDILRVHTHPDAMAAYVVCLYSGLTVALLYPKQIKETRKSLKEDCDA